MRKKSAKKEVWKIIRAVGKQRRYLLDGDDVSADSAFKFANAAAWDYLPLLLRLLPAEYQQRPSRKARAAR